MVGFPQVFFLGSCFRNESLDHTHTFEYNHFEYYTTQHNFKEVQRNIEKLYCHLYYLIHKEYHHHGVDLRDPWPIYKKEDLTKLIQTHKQLLNLELSEQHFQTNVEKLIKTKVLGPFFHLQGIAYNPLAKDDQLIFDSYVDYTMELATGYQEENDALALSNKKTIATDIVVDENFVQDLKFGMPDTVGIGIGVDRLVKSILKVETLRDIQVFPHI